MDKELGVRFSNLSGCCRALPRAIQARPVSISCCTGLKSAAHEEITCAIGGGGEEKPSSSQKSCTTVYNWPRRVFCIIIWVARRWGSNENAATRTGGRLDLRWSSARLYSYVGLSRGYKSFLRAVSTNLQKGKAKKRNRFESEICNFKFSKNAIIRAFFVFLEISLTSFARSSSISALAKDALSRSDRFVFFLEVSTRVWYFSKSS